MYDFGQVSARLVTRVTAQKVFPPSQRHIVVLLLLLAALSSPRLLPQEPYWASAGADAPTTSFLHLLLSMSVEDKDAVSILLVDNPVFQHPPARPLTDARRADLIAVLNRVDEQGCTPLLFALVTGTGTVNACRRLAGHPLVDVAARYNGITAAHAAAQRGGDAGLATLRVLAARDPALLAATDDSGRPPVLSSSCQRCTSFLLDATKASKPILRLRAAQPPFASMLTSIADPLHHRCDFFLTRPPSVACFQVPHAGLLKRAFLEAFLDSPAVLQALLRAGVDPAAPWDAESADGRTAWHAACSGTACEFGRHHPERQEASGRQHLLLAAILECGWSNPPPGVVFARRSNPNRRPCLLRGAGVLGLRDGAGGTPLHAALEAIESRLGIPGDYARIEKSAFCLALAAHDLFSSDRSLGYEQIREPCPAASPAGGAASV